MPDIDPAALSRTDSTKSGPSVPTPAPIKPPPISAPAQRSTPRIDLEPLYTSLKSAIGDYWSTYKDALSRYILGHLSQQELYQQTSQFINIDPHREHLHNQLIGGIQSNTFRDAPETNVAGWVSANDKPTAGLAKPVTGDAAEQRLKNEVMQLPPRVRHRIKSVKDEPRNPLTHNLQLEASTRRFPTSHLSPAQIPSTSHQPPTSATNPNTTTQPLSATASQTGLNKDLDIRRRYTLPLFQESRDIPPASALTDRILPICYEESLLSGASPASTISDLLSDAIDSFVKEVLAGVLGRTRVNPAISDPASAIDAEVRANSGNANANNVPSSSASNDSGYEGSNAAATTATIDLSAAGLGAGSSVQGVATAAYKLRVEAESRAAARGELKRNEVGLLPVEEESARAQNQGRGLPGDLGIAWDMGDPWLGSMTPWCGERLAANGWESAWDDVGEEEDELMGGVVGVGVDGAMDGIISHAPRSSRGVNGDGRNNPPDDPMAIDEADWGGWPGGSKSERKALGGLLDDCLADGE